jgi:peptidoglycan/xylan/chitin deacetylase (PgdA/CDA1 family)
VLGEAVLGSLGSAAALMTYAVRAPSSSLLGPSVYRGDVTRRSIALTFDDGPSEGTPLILQVLEKYKIPATFFQCGANVRRLPDISKLVISSGHEIGNHTETHPNLSFHSRSSIAQQFRQAQVTIEDTVNLSPSLMRAPFGVRWFGFRQIQQELKLLGVMWTVIARDWKMSGPAVARRLERGAVNGAIFCLHDGRELQRSPDVSATAEALRILIPGLLKRGFQFETVTRIQCPKN